MTRRLIRAALLAGLAMVLGRSARADEPVAQLIVATVPSGADVSVDGQPAGSAPVTVRNLLPGAHYVEAHWIDGKQASAMVTLGAGVSKLVSLAPGQSAPAAPEAAPPVAPAQPPPQYAAPNQPLVHPALTASPRPPAKNLRRTGIALTATGIALTALGAILCGVTPAVMHDRGDAVPALLGIGATFLIGGVALVIPGSVLWAKNP